MDTPAHGIWTWIIYHNNPLVWLAVLFGMLPDIFSWGIFMFLPKKGFDWNNPDWTLIPKWIYVLYGITHSLIVVAVVFLVVYLAIGHLPLYLLAWPLHIIIDIPMHRKEFLPTPFLWPVSKWGFPGFSWGEKWFMILNYIAITIVLLIIYL